MKNKITFFLICLIYCLILQTNAQTEFAPIGAEWHYTYARGGQDPNRYLNSIISEKDTIIEGNRCRILRQYYNNSNIASEKYIIKQKNGKVYHYYQDQFYLLFDFDVEVNDTIRISFIGQRIGDNLFLPDTVISLRYKIESITTNAHNLKEFVAEVLDEDLLELPKYIMRNWLYTYRYTERIGNEVVFLPFSFIYPETANHHYSLRCYSDSDIAYISDWWNYQSLPCNYSINSGIDTLNDENVKIYPNPFNDNVFVFTKDERNIEIIDISGKVVYSSELLNGMNEISTTHFLKGIYLVKIQNKDNSIQTFKIIKS